MRQVLCDRLARLRRCPSPAKRGKPTLAAVKRSPTPNESRRFEAELHCLYRFLAPTGGRHVRSTEADVQVIVMPRKWSGQTVRDEQGVVEQDPDVRELPPHHDDELSREGVVVRRVVDVGRARLAVVPERPQVDVAPVLV